MDADAIDRAGAADAGAQLKERGTTDEAEQVLRRLERIEALDRERAPAGQLLGELRELVHEAEAWARVECDGAADGGGGDLREEAEGMR